MVSPNVHKKDLDKTFFGALSQNYSQFWCAEKRGGYRRPGHTVKVNTFFFHKWRYILFCVRKYDELIGP